MRPEKLSIRAINQYRARDIISYLGLRYYFANQCARRDRWATEVASHLVLTRSDPGYFKSMHFKDMTGQGKIGHREVFLPGPNESFAETALLAECSKHVEFQSPPYVFSYRLSQGNESQGAFTPYFLGLQSRHKKIAAACHNSSGNIVLYTDIKRFYPSIPKNVALAAWQAASDNSKLDIRTRELGLKLLADHASTALKHSHGSGLLTGPIFSHLIANLVLRDVDEAMSSLFPGRYFRYVDDVVLVGTTEQIKYGRDQLCSRLSKISLELHDRGAGKDFEVSANEWLAGEEDFADGTSKGWMVFSRNLKQSLVLRPASRPALDDSFRAEGFRLPLPDYSVDVSGARYQKRFVEMLERMPWLWKRIARQSTPEHLLLFVRNLRREYFLQLELLLKANSDINGYSRKRIIPKIRYYAGRLLYLGKTEELGMVAEKLREYPELLMLAEVLNAVASRDVTNLLALGSNAVQSAAQALKLDPRPVTCRIEDWGPVERQGLAVLHINGIATRGPHDDPINRFALWKQSDHPYELMEGQDSFIREVSCLHGVANEPRHQAILETAFDQGEELVFDATTPIDTY